MRLSHLAFPVVLVAFAVSSAAGEAGTELPEVVVKDSALPESPFLSPVEGAAIFSGKKASKMELKEIPVPPQNTYRQLFAKTPGLLVSEVANESFTSFSYRGLGDPHESFNLNILKDGLPINADPFGYPAVYYQPPLDSIESMQFVRGGSSLLYGPQVGGALNFISRRPTSQEANAFLTKQVLGSKSLWSSYNQVTASAGGVGVLGFFHRRQGDGFRDENSDFYVNNGSLKVAFDSGERTHWNIEFDLYDASHGEAGGLALNSAPGVLGFNENRWASTLNFDRLEIERYYPSIQMVSDLSESTKLEWRATGGYYRRASYRQDLGAAPAFGGVPLGTTNTVQVQEFRTITSDLRALHEYELGGEKHQFTGGFFFFLNDSPFRQEKGQSAFSRGGDLVKEVSRETIDASVFAENRFVLGRFSLTPGFRLENVHQEVDEETNAGSLVPLRSTDETNTVPLVSVGAAFDLGSHSEIYANFSQGYKPVTFQDSVPLSTGDLISTDIDEADSYSYEIGVRGSPLPALNFDASWFYYDFDNQFGRVGPVIQNTGRGRYSGVDLAFEADLLGAADEAFGAGMNGSFGKFSLYSNVSLLEAEFTEGSLDGKTPQYAPDYLLRVGAIYEFPKYAKLALLGTFVDEHFADDGNSAERFIPSYTVWDLTSEVQLYGDTVGVVAGIQNLFDEKYYSRIRSNGIDPASPRNFYAGLVVRF